MKRLIFFLMMIAAVICRGQTVNTNIYPASSGLSLGRISQQWNGYFRNVVISGSCTIAGAPCAIGSSSIGTYTVASLPAAPPLGTLAVVTDANGFTCTSGGASNNILCQWNGSAWIPIGVNFSAPSFSAIANGTSTATFLMGSGGSLSFSGTGIVNANELNGGTLPASAALLATNSSKQPTAITTIPTSTVPAFTGDMTNSAGSLSTTVGKINNLSIPALTGPFETNSSNQFIQVPKYLYTQNLTTGATWIDRLVLCYGLLTTGGYCDMHGEATGTSSANVTATIPSNITVFLPPVVLVEGNNSTISFANPSTSLICQDENWDCIIDGSNNGSVGVINISASFVRVKGVWIKGGRLNSQTGTEINVSNNSAPIVGVTLSHVKVTNAGSVGVNFNNCSFCGINDHSEVDSSQQSDVNLNANAFQTEGVYVQDSLFQDGMIGAVTGNASGVNVQSTGGQGFLRYVDISRNVVKNGTQNGGSGSVTFVNGNSTFTWVSGTTLTTSWVNQLAPYHITAQVNGVAYDFAIQSVNTGAQTGVLGVPGGSAVNFNAPSGTYNVEVYSTPCNPAYLLSQGYATTVGTAVTWASHSGTNLKFDTNWASAPPNGGNWFFVFNGSTYTIASSALSGCVGNACTGMTLTTSAGTVASATAYSVYATPSVNDTGCSEGIQPTALPEYVDVHDNTLFNIADEGITCETTGCKTRGNTIRDPGQLSQGTGCAIQSIQAIIGGSQTNITVGPTEISGNKCIADSGVGVQAQGVAVAAGNPLGKVGYTVWENVGGTTLGTSNFINDQIITGNNGGVQGNGTMVYGFEYTNSTDGGNNTPVTLTNDVIADNIFDTSVLSPLAITYYTAANSTCGTGIGDGTHACTTGVWDTSRQPIPSTSIIPTSAPCAGMGTALCVSNTSSGVPVALVINSQSIRLNGNTSPIVYYVGGYYQQITSLLTVPTCGSAPCYTPPASGATNETEFFIFAKWDPNGTVVLADLEVTSCPLLISYVVPASGNVCSNAGAGGSAGLGTPNPQYWYNLATNQMARCTGTCGTAGNYQVQPAILLGVFAASNTTVDAVLTVPFNESPYYIYNTYGSGTDGPLSLATNATVTKDGQYRYSSLMIADATTLSPSQWATNLNTPGLFVYSQTPALILGSSFLSGLGLGGPGAAASSAAAGTAPANTQGFGGAGGGGGGATITNNGGAGGKHYLFGLVVSAAAAAGTPTNTGGTGGALQAAWASTSTIINSAEPLSYLNMVGNGGGSGGSIAAGTGGAGGNGGIPVFLKAPSLNLVSGSKIICDGAVGGNGATNGGGGGGGGAGACGFIGAFSLNGTAGLSASGGAGGTQASTAGAGGPGGNGLIVATPIQ